MKRTDWRLWTGMMMAAAAIGCAGKPPLVLIPQTLGVPDSPETRNPVLRGDLAGPAEDVWVREGDPVRPVADEAAKPKPTNEPYVTLRMDNRTAVLDPVTGHLVVRGPTSLSPMLRFDLSEAAGKFERLIIVVSEYRSGGADPGPEYRILAGDELQPGVEFPLNRPGKNVRIRTGEGDTVESFDLKPATTYVAWLQIQTAGRRAGKPWPWPHLRFRTADAS